MLRQYSFPRRTGFRQGERQTGLSGYVFRDGNNNGQRESGESGIPNALVILTGTTPGGSPFEVTRLTNAAGFYSFGNPPTGTLRISAPQPGTAAKTDAAEKPAAAAGAGR